MTIFKQMVVEFSPRLLLGIPKMNEKWCYLSHNNLSVTQFFLVIVT